MAVILCFGAEPVLQSVRSRTFAPFRRCCRWCQQLRAGFRQPRSSAEPVGGEKKNRYGPGAFVTTVPGPRGGQGQVEAGAEPGRALRVLEAPQKRSAERAAFGVFGGLPQFYRGGC